MGENYDGLDHFYGGVSSQRTAASSSYPYTTPTTPMFSPKSRFSFDTDDDSSPANLFRDNSDLPFPTSDQELPSGGQKTNNERRILYAETYRRLVSPYPASVSFENLSNSASQDQNPENMGAASHFGIPQTPRDCQPRALQHVPLKRAPKEHLQKRHHQQHSNAQMQQDHSQYLISSAKNRHHTEAFDLNHFLPCPSPCPLFPEMNKWYANANKRWYEHGERAECISEKLPRRLRRHLNCLKNFQGDIAHLADNTQTLINRIQLMNTIKYETIGVAVALFLNMLSEYRKMVGLHTLAKQRQKSLNDKHTIHCLNGAFIHKRYSTRPEDQGNIEALSRAGFDLEIRVSNGFRKRLSIFYQDLEEVGRQISMIRNELAIFWYRNQRLVQWNLDFEPFLGDLQKP
jgi:hypothetical protein